MSVFRYSRFSGVGNGNPLQCSWLENPRDRRAWQGTVHGIAESDMIEPWLGLPGTFSTWWSTIQMSDYISHHFIMFTILYHSAYTTIYYLGRFGLPVSCLQLNAVYSTHLSVHDVRALGMHTGTGVSVTFSILGLNILRKDRSSLDLYSNDHFYQ